MKLNLLMANKRVILVPYEAHNWEHLAAWMLDADYQEFFRHNPLLSKEELVAYPSIVQGHVFMVCHADTKQIIGMVQAVPNRMKRTSAFFAGAIIDKEYQNKGYIVDAFVVLFGFMFNQLGYRKGIVEILQSRSNLKKLLLDSGFLFEGVQFKESFYNGNWVNELRFSLSAVFYHQRWSSHEQPTENRT